MANQCTTYAKHYNIIKALILWNVWGILLCLQSYFQYISLLVFFCKNHALGCFFFSFLLITMRKRQDEWMQWSYREKKITWSELILKMIDVIREDVGGQFTAFQLFWRENKGTELILPSTAGLNRLSLLFVFQSRKQDTRSNFKEPHNLNTLLIFAVAYL